MLQNPELAYTLGKITPEEYFSMTGKYPNGYGIGGGDEGGGGSSRGRSGTPQGYYSSGTVANIQKQLGVSADGIAGPKTYAALQKANTNGQYDYYLDKWYN